MKRWVYWALNIAFVLAAYILLQCFYLWESHVFDYSRHYTAERTFTSFSVTLICTAAAWYVALEAGDIFFPKHAVIKARFKRVIQWISKKCS